MVTSITSFGRSGLSDWLVQRVTAVILLAYTIFITWQLACGTDYPQWRALFEQTWVRVFSLSALLSTVAHAWVGLWAVSTDYLVEHVLRIKTNEFLASRANLLRWAFQGACGIVAFYYLVWGIQVLWS